MVPGMTERERRAGDARRIEWLADAYRGPASVIKTPDRGQTAALSLLRRTRPTPSLQDLRLCVLVLRARLMRPLTGRGAIPIASSLTI